MPARFLVSLRTTGCLLNFFFSHHSVVLREISGREYERITNTFFLWLYHTSWRSYYRCEKFTRVPHRSERFARICHICERFARILHRCDKYVRIFTLVTDSFDFHVRNESVTHVKNSHVFVTQVKNLKAFIKGVINTCELFTRLKLDICEKLVPIKISKLVVYVYFTHTKMCHIRANNSQRVKNTKCEY